jgi:hypothetical protein
LPGISGLIGINLGGFSGIKVYTGSDFWCFPGIGANAGSEFFD